jgi:hypothetical protein
MVEEKNIERKLEVNFGLKKDSNIKFKEYFPVDKSIPRVYYELYGDCAPQMFKIEKTENNIKKAYGKNKFLGKALESYYIFFEGYISKKKEDKISRQIFESVMELDKNYVKEKIKKKITEAYNKNKIFGFLTRKYYEQFENI